MQTLFQFDNLLNNEYLLKKFQVDPFNVSQLVLPYEVVQRENSIKNQYVQNEQNSRKQYHLILTKILNEYNGRLWNYDSQFLIIRPYYPKERKIIYIKVSTENKEQLIESIKASCSTQDYTLVEEPYQADPTFVKVYVTATNEAKAKELFQVLKNLKLIKSIVMDDFDHLSEFQKLLQQKKYHKYIEAKLAKQTRDEQYSIPEGDSTSENSGYDRPRQQQWQNRQYGRPYQQYPPRYQQQPYQKQFYVPKANPPPPPSQAPAENYQLVRKSSLNSSPTTKFRTPIVHPKDFPALGNTIQLIQLL